MSHLKRLRERDHFEDTGVDGRTILKRIFMKQEWALGLDCSGSGQGQVAGACDCGKERSVP